LKRARAAAEHARPVLDDELVLDLWLGHALRDQLADVRTLGERLGDGATASDSWQATHITSVSIAVRMPGGWPAARRRLKAVRGQRKQEGWDREADSRALGEDARQGPLSHAG